MSFDPPSWLKLLAGLAAVVLALYVLGNVISFLVTLAFWLVLGGLTVTGSYYLYQALKR